MLKRYGYVYDPVGNRTTAQTDDAPRAWTYDALNRITGQTGGGVLSFAGTVSEPASVTVEGRAAGVDATNRFGASAEVGTGTNTVTLTATDASGNTAIGAYGSTSRPRAPVSATMRTGTSRSRDRRRTSGMRPTGWCECSRAASNWPASRTTDSGGARRRQSVGCRGRTSTMARTFSKNAWGAVDTRHVHVPAIDNPLASVANGSAVSYYLADHLGSIVQTTDATVQIVSTRQYDPFGGPLLGAAASGYAFTRREWDAETGLYFYRARYFDPHLARFTNADPLDSLRGRTSTRMFAKTLCVGSIR